MGQGIQPIGCSCGSCMACRQPSVQSPPPATQPLPGTSTSGGGADAGPPAMGAPHEQACSAGVEELGPPPMGAPHETAERGIAPTIQDTPITLAATPTPTLAATPVSPATPTIPAMPVATYPASVVAPPEDEEHPDAGPSLQELVHDASITPPS